MNTQQQLIERYSTQAYNTNKARLRLIEAKRAYTRFPNKYNQERVASLESELNGVIEPEVLEYKIKCLINNN